MEKITSLSTHTERDVEPKNVLRFGPYFALMGLGNILTLIPIENISMGIVL